MRRSVVSVFLFACVLSVAIGGSAFAAIAPDTTEYTTAAECLECHGVGGAAVSRADFSAATVDYAKCVACHDFLNTGRHYHLSRTTCTSCHNGVTKFVLNFPADALIVGGLPARTDFGYFAYPDSLATTPEQLHALHDGGGWVERAWGSITRWPNGYPAAAGSTPCSGCHAAATCTACHVSPPAAHGDHAVSGYPAVSVRQATGTAVTTAASTCINPSCHALAAAGTPAFVPSCGSCHGGKTVAHGYADVDHVAADGAAEGFACSECHALDLATVHGDPTAVGASCATCHPTPRDSFQAWDQSCATGGCHTAGSSAPMHAGTASAHAVSTENELCLECHSGSELGAIHVEAEDLADGTTSCRVCHKSVGTPQTSDCTVCHFSFGDHYGAAAHQSATFSCAGTGCHDVLAGLMTVHDERNAEFGCRGCHDSVRSDVQEAIEAGLTGCADCHSSMTATGGHRSVHWPTPLLADAAGPNYSYYTGSAGTAPTGDCAGCHTSNLVDEHMGIVDLSTGFIVRLPRRDSTGAILTCDTCHGQPAGSPVQDAIASGTLACEGCHQVHGPMQVVHDSSFVDAPAFPCADCHSADLRTEHNGGYTSSAGLTGCDVCHALYDGELAATVQSAISLGNSTKCDACHASYHADTEAHTAVAAGSLACASCHDSSATTSVDTMVVHAGATAGPCKVCHASQRLGGLGGRTAECASCHSSEGADYHRVMEARHAFGAMGEGCQTCHVATLPEAHEPYLSRFPQYADTCALCHKNADPTRIPAGATANCDDCHDIHGDINVIHTATSSQACVSCHETGLTLGIHTKPDGTADCGTCHAAAPGRIDWSTATRECTSCHASLSPADPQHYPVASHATTFEAGCSNCHSADLKSEHFKATVSPSVTCVSCHEQRVDSFTTTWDKSCTACHASRHGNQAQAHRSSNTSCTGSGCHAVADVSALHGTSCEACHASGITPSTDCMKCHTGANPHHATITLNMSTSSQWQTVCGSCHGRVHSFGSSCLNCHSRDMHGEEDHVEQNSNCAVCHKVAAVDASDNCLGCHKNLSSSSDGGWGDGGWGDGGGWGGGSTNTYGAVSGTVTNSATGAAISGATVTVAGRSATSSSSGTYTVSDVTSGTYTITVTATGYGAWSGSITVSSGSTLTKNVALTATAPTLANLARSGAATASSTDSSTNSASKAIDGDTASYWRSGSGGTQWLRVDLLSAKTLSKVVVRWVDSRYARSFQVQTSNDGSNWTTRYSTTSGSGGTSTITFAPVSARYVRVYCTQTNDSHYRVSEFEAWGY